MATVLEAQHKINFPLKKGRNVTLLHAKNTTVPILKKIVRKIGATKIVPFPMTLPLLLIQLPLKTEATEAK